MQKITKDKVSFIIILFISSVVIISPFATIGIQTTESQNLPTSNSLASEYVFEWNSSLGGVYVDGARGVAVDSNDNVYLAGYQDLSGSNTNRDMVIAKYNPQGAQQWVRYWGGSNDDIPYDIIIDSSNNIFIVGFTKSFEDVDGDAVILKYNITGHQQWNFTWGGSQFDAAISIDIDSANNYYIGGWSHSFGDTDGDVFLAKFNSNWIEQWNETWGGSDTEEGIYVHIDKNDDIYTCGRSDSLDPSPAEGDAFLNKYNSSGNLLWSRSWGGSYTQGASGIATDSLNDVYIICMTFGHPASSGKGAIVKYNSEGTYQWEEIWGVNGVYANYMYRIIIDSNDDLYISGTTRSYGIPNNNDAILFNYDTNGNQNWYKIWSEYEWDLSFGLCMDSQSNIYLVGDTKSYSVGENDILLLKYAFANNIPNINIFTPENKTYTGGMSGYYPATFGFENIENGATPVVWEDISISSSCSISIYDEIGNHKKIVRIYDADTGNGSGADTTAQHIFKENRSTGTIECWVYKESGNSPIYVQGFQETTWAFAIRIDMENNGKFEYSPGPSTYVEFGNGKYSDQTWFHLRIDFDCGTDTTDIYLDGVKEVDAGVFGQTTDNITKIQIRSAYSGHSGILYFDAVGYSWDQNYDISDNMNEGLLLSYENTTILDWQGYSLDGQANKTILGNITIPLPIDGSHNIQVFGNTTGDLMYESNVRYFTVNTASFPYIEIITPEARTYFEPIAGYYPATHGFENELGGTSGTVIEYVDVTTISSGCEVQIYDEYQGHKKVLRLHDGNTAGNARAQHDFSSTHTSGYVEWWWNTPVSGSNGMAYHFHEGSLGTHAGTVIMKDGNFLDMEGNVIQSYVANRWYHHKIAFDTIWDQYDWYIDGILVVNDGNFENHVTNIGSTNIKGGWTSTGSCYIDAVGFSWDPGYFVGDNYKEGLLLSYLNITNFDWIGYSLDGSSNITITGYKVIPLPENGIHSIVLNGITSTGTSIQSDVRYFTINYQEPPLPPIPPIIPEPLNLIPIIMNSIGFGIIALLAITLILFIKHNKTQLRT